MTVVVPGRAACARLLRLLADQIEDGSILYPPSVQPAPHLGPYVLRVAGVDYDMAAGLPGIIEGADDEATKP